MFPVLEAKNITKIYRIYNKPTDRLKELITGKKHHREHVALRNITLKLYEGEVLGIVGENGAGKSTLLSILAGILPPTSGTVQTRGRVAAILELGAGFHPDLSGYENIFMYANLLGIPKSDIKRKIDFIEDFSELNGFLDKPIKTYSTGMVVRLAFSTILAVEPSVFIIDEALAVGDLHFQYKSFNALRKFKENGGAIIFTSHSTYQITSICDRAIWIKHGEINMEGEPLQVVKEYEDYMREKNKLQDEVMLDSLINGRSDNSKNLAWISNFFINKERIAPGESLQLIVEVRSEHPQPLHIGIVFKRNDGLWVSVYSTKHEGKIIKASRKSVVTFEFYDFPILHGAYIIEAYLLDETGNLVYDVKNLNLDIAKTSPLDIGVFRIRGSVNVEYLD